MKKLSPFAVGISVGIVMGAGLFLLGLGAWLIGLGSDIVEVASSLYKGYAPTPLGSLIGGIWAFIDWFIGGVIFAWIYNKFAE